MGHPKRYSQADHRLFTKIGKRIRYLRREEYHWSQAGLARQLGCSRETISQMERGCRPPSPKLYILFSRIFSDEEVYSIPRFPLSLTPVKVGADGDNDSIHNAAVRFGAG